jgi:hypothetical protein
VSPKDERMSTAKKKTSKPAMAFTASGPVKGGTVHLVGIGNLRVVIVQDDKHWFAQGLEIDYAEQGDSVEDVKKNFENGLRATIEQHLKINGTIKKLLRVAPPEVWADVLGDPSADRNFYSQISVHKIIEKLPFEGIQYLIAKDAKDAASVNAC